MTTAIIYLVIAAVFFGLGIYVHSQWSEKLTTDLQKAKTDAEYLLVSARAELNALKDRMSVVPAKPPLPTPPPIPNPPPP
jgi:hypothetical protein